MTVTIHHGDCREVVRGLDPMDAVVCDPPYGLKFMGKGWDHGVPGVEFWEAILGCMKPGAHLLAFGGTRTHHRLMVAIEDAGFEMRDTLMWVYGSGFPKSLDVGKAIDKAAGAEHLREFRCKNPADRPYTHTVGETSTGWKSPARPDKTAPATDAAKQWDGWGTALKPAWEPIIMARKPLEGTVAANVLKYGVGGLDIDGCRVGSKGGGTNCNNRDDAGRCRGHNNGGRSTSGETVHANVAGTIPKGRWPANLIHDGSQEVLDLFPETVSMAGNKTTGFRHGGNSGHSVGMSGTKHAPDNYADHGTPARFFYCAKASRRERGEENCHPTVKPIALMRYLCRLVTPPGGIILDPFMGSGSTLVAAQAEGFDAIGIDTEESYCEIARARVSA